MPIPLAFTKLLRSFESCAEAVEKLVIFRKGAIANILLAYYILNMNKHSVCMSVEKKVLCYSFSMEVDFQRYHGHCCL